jgi:hypothetical protein
MEVPLFFQLAHSQPPWPGWLGWYGLKPFLMRAYIFKGMRVGCQKNGAGS